MVPLFWFMWPFIFRCRAITEIIPYSSSLPNRCLPCLMTLIRSSLTIHMLSNLNAAMQIMSATYSPFVLGDPVTRSCELFSGTYIPRIWTL
ncbi:hypothetical protein QBC42DRAFT_34266 [Cladorrhinum samala]|uniref:Secreted protein n=1 Tax=Cladorrhinum samala TaxID=585594 RepID=A0AAV9HCW2_9PEZI|nr:hypothetical protein QBC42DRAFT_34266 [Cladorrhinum samala]